MLYIHMTVRYPSQRHGTKIKFDHSSHIAESIRGTNRVSLWTDDDDEFRWGVRRSPGGKY